MIQISWSALLFDIPVELYQPDGTVLNCYVSGDEYYNYLHDIEGYTIIQSDTDGYYYYAKKENNQIIPSEYRPDQNNDLAALGLSKRIMISQTEYIENRNRKWQDVEQTRDAPTIGTLNNLNVFIRFADEEEFQLPRSYYDTYFNDENGRSMQHYFHEVSYELLTVNTHHYPACDINTNLSYQDQYPRAYYKPYNENSNPDL